MLYTFQYFGQWRRLRNDSSSSSVLSFFLSSLSLSYSPVVCWRRASRTNFFHCCLCINNTMYNKRQSHNTAVPYCSLQDRYKAMNFFYKFTLNFLEVLESTLHQEVQELIPGLFILLAFCSCWGDGLQEKATCKAPSFQIGSGWNLAGLFFT